MDAGEFRKRENKAVAASAAGAIGAAIGGKAGYGILDGSSWAGLFFVPLQVYKKVLTIKNSAIHFFFIVFMVDR